MPSFVLLKQNTTLLICYLRSNNYKDQDLVENSECFNCTPKRQSNPRSISSLNKTVEMGPGFSFGEGGTDLRSSRCLVKTIV